MEKDPRLAKRLSIISFLFSFTISVGIFFTEETLDAVDYALIVLMPLAFAVGAYFVGLYHDPSASE
jgi:hypothetical protein